VRSACRVACARSMSTGSLQPSLTGQEPAAVSADASRFGLVPPVSEEGPAAAQRRSCEALAAIWGRVRAGLNLRHVCVFASRVAAMGRMSVCGLVSCRPIVPL